MKDEKENSVFSKPSIGVKIVLSAWMFAIYFFYIFMFTPPFIIVLIGKTGLVEQFLYSQKQVKSFFQTTDFSDYIKNQQAR